MKVGRASVPATAGRDAGPTREQAGGDGGPTREQAGRDGGPTREQAGRDAGPTSEKTGPAPGPYIRTAHRETFAGYRRRLPHWRLPDATYFVTWRLRPGTAELKPDERTLVADALAQFDGTRYHLFAFVVMHDHVHALVQPLPDHPLESVLHSWKSYTANRLQRLHGRKGRVWLDESFDRVVRDESEFYEKLEYILGNPFKTWSEIREYPWMGVHSTLADIGPLYRAGTEARPTVGGPAPTSATWSEPELAAYERIDAAAKELNEQRERWLNPPEWINSVAQYVDHKHDFSDVPAEARDLIRQSAIMAEAARDPRLKKRTLTNLYNERPTWLRLAHEKLDRAVLAAYAAVDPEGDWSEDWAEVWVETGAGQPLRDDHPLAERRKDIDQRVLANLLRLNLARAAQQNATK